HTVIWLESWGVRAPESPAIGGGHLRDHRRHLLSVAHRPREPRNPSGGAESDAGAGREDNRPAGAGQASLHPVPGLRREPPLGLTRPLTRILPPASPSP